MSRLIAALCFMSLYGCTSYYAPMSALNIRSAIDQCNDLNLDVLVYERPDGSVVDIRCIPSQDEVKNRIMVRPRIPDKLIQGVFYERMENK